MHTIVSVAMYSSMVFLMGSNNRTSPPPAALTTTKPTPKQVFADRLETVYQHARSLPNYAVTNDDKDLHALFDCIKIELFLARGVAEDTPAFFEPRGLALQALDVVVAVIAIQLAAAAIKWLVRFSLRVLVLEPLRLLADVTEALLDAYTRFLP